MSYPDAPAAQAEVTSLHLRVGPDPGAALLAASVGGLLRALSWAFRVDLAPLERGLVALVELSHWLTFGVYFALTSALAARISRAFQRAPRASRAAYWAWLYAAFLLPLAPAVHGDLTGFAARQEALPASTVLTLGVTLAPLVPLLVLLGAAHARLRWGRATAIVLSLTGALAIFANSWVLPHDYAGVHLIIAFIGGALLAPACSGLIGGWLAFTLLALPALGWALLGTPSTVAAKLVSDSGAALSPTLERARFRIKPRARASRVAVRAHPEWFTSRAKLPERAPRPGPISAPLVLLISIDAVRADVIHSGEYDERLPTFTALRQRGAAFSAARSPATLTKLSLGSLFRGNYYSQQYWTLRRKGLYVPAKDKTVTLPTLLSRGGVRTVNVRTIAWLTNGPFFRGFASTYLAKDPKSRYASVRYALPELRKAIEKAGDAPTFLFTHLSDPHAPYSHGKGHEPEFERYLHELEYVDAHLAKLLAYVEARGLAERTYVIVTSDHGEEFGEHGAKTHGTTLYDPALRVPLIIAGPGVVARRIPDNVTTLDLVPTVLDLFQIPTPGTVMAESLLGVALGEEPRFTRPIAAETRLLRAFITPQNLKLIWDTQTGHVEAYDLNVDPGEQRNLYGRSSAADDALLDAEDFFRAHAFTARGYQPPFFR